MLDGGVAEGENERTEKETDGVSWSREDGADTPSRTASLTPTMARALEKRAVKEQSLANQGSEPERETMPIPQQGSTPSVKLNRKVRPTRRRSTQSFGQTSQGVTGLPAGRSGPSPAKKASGDDAGEGNAALSTSVSSSHSKAGMDGNNTLAHLPVSTDNLLMHLHTDPRSSHITLSASASAGAKAPPPVSVNPALLTAGGGSLSSSKSGSRSRAASSSSPSKIDKGKGKADATGEGASSRSSSRSVSKRPSADKFSDAQKGYREPDLRESSSTSRLNLNRSFSSRLPVSQPDGNALSPSAISEGVSSVGITPSEASASASSPGPDTATPMGYFDHRPRAASSSMTSRDSNPHDPSSTTTTPGEDWPSHDITQEIPIDGRVSQGERRSMDFRQDLVVGGLAGTPRFDTDGESRLSPSLSAASRAISPRASRDATNSATTGLVERPAEPDSGLVSFTVSDSTAVKMETLIPGDVADKIEQTNDVTTKQAILEAIQEPAAVTQPPSDATSPFSGIPPAGLGFFNVDLAAANMPSPPAPGTTSPPLPADASATGVDSESTGEACINEFSNLLSEAMMQSGRRSSTASSTSSSSKKKGGTTLIGTAGTLGDASEWASYTLSCR